MVMKSHGCIAGVLLLGVTCAWAGDPKQPPGKGDPRAAALLEEAAKTRYTWSPEVTTVSGKISWDQDGHAGGARFHSVLHKRGGLTLTGENGAAVPADVKDHLASLIGHRTAPYPGAAERSPAESVIVVEDDQRGPLILTVGDPMQSSERVKDGRLVQVNRAMGSKRFTIDVTEFEKVPDGLRIYPAAFTVTWWDAATGKRLEKQTYTTRGFYLSDGQMFPRAEKVVTERDGKRSVLAIQYGDIKFETGRPRTASK
jgi:Protein of unknown function (DUF3386)